MFEKIKNNLSKNGWLALLVAIISGVMVFTQFYDIILVRKNNSSAQVKENDSEERDINTEPVTVKDPQLNIDPDKLEPDLENLSQDDLAAVDAFLIFKKIKNQIIPSGVPGIYGKELAVNFDRVQESMNKMRIFGPTYGKKGEKISLTEQEKKRYINIASQTACEYCCGVASLVRQNGQPACGCAHSIVMRALTAYLIRNHPRLSDEQILNEVNAWKRAFFPKQSIAKAISQMKGEKRKEVEQILQEFPSFLPQMVGGC